MDNDGLQQELEERLNGMLCRVGLGDVWRKMPPSHRAQWLRHVAEARKPETRTRRLEKVVAAMRERAAGAS